MKKNTEMDMCHGPLFGKILLFSIPLMLTGILQLLFNAADTIVVGRFAGHTALAAVVSTSALIQLLTNLFIGFSVGANVMVARYYGAKKENEVSETVHTSIALSFVCVVILLVAGMCTMRQILIWMGTPQDVLDQAAEYLKIYFIGMPALLVFNFGSSILRAIGDTRRPLYFLFASGIVNVLLNLFLVIVFQMGVKGVAIATVVSETLSALLILRWMIHLEGSCRLSFSGIRLNRHKVLQIIRIGLPAGLQGVIFSFSNVLIQSSVNSFGSIAMAGNTAAANLEGFVYMAMNTFHQTAMSFTSQNFGAGKKERIPRILLMCMALVTIVGLSMGFGMYFGGKGLLRIYSSDSEVIQYGLLRMSVICTTYFLCGNMDTLVGALRGLGYSVMPMVVSLIGACGLRVVWLYTVFEWKHTLWILYLSYPITWIITASVHIICYLLAYKKLKKII